MLGTTTETTEANATLPHHAPADLLDAVGTSAKARTAWGDITALARNEWICWVESAKRTETRERRIARARDELAEGKRRPCCWPGCSHRK